MRFSRREENRVTFEICAENSGEVLPRVVMLLHRLYIEIEALSMVRRREAKKLRLHVTIDAGERLRVRAEESLWKIVNVLDVKRVYLRKSPLPGSRDEEDPQS